MEMDSDPATSFSPTPPAKAEHVQTFYPFQRLPFEIRQLIWYRAALEPRIVEVGFYVTRVKKRNETRNTCKTLVPALLHVCSESREVGLKHYDKLIPMGKFTRTYINWAQDYVYLDCSHYQYLDFLDFQNNLSDNKKEAWMQQCRRLLIGRRLYMALDTIFELFTSIEDIAVLHRDQTWSGRLHDNVNEISGTVGGDIKLSVVDPSTVQLEPVAPHTRSYHPLWFHINSHRERWKYASLVKATRGVRRPLSRVEKSTRKELERQENQLPAKPKKEKFQNWRVPDLKVEAQNRGLSTQGFKAELVSRLKADEQIPFSLALEQYEKEMKEHLKAKENGSSATV